VAPIIPYSATLNTGYIMLELSDGVAWCYIGGIGLLTDRIFFTVSLRDRSADVCATSRAALARGLLLGSVEIESAHRYILQQRLKLPGAYA
jgi:hypothetical protein